MPKMMTREEFNERLAAQRMTVRATHGIAFALGGILGACLVYFNMT